MLTKNATIHSKMENIFEFFWKTSKFSAASKSKHLKNKKKHTNSFSLSPIFEIQTNYKSISPNISFGKNTSNISKHSEKYIRTTYAKDFFSNIQILSPFGGNSNAYFLIPI